MKIYKRSIKGNEIRYKFKSIKEIKNINDLNPVRQISGIFFNKERKVIIISNKPNKWTIPGGKPEYGETFEDTLKREAEEEANIKLGKCKPIGIIEINYPNNPNHEEGEIFFQLRYVAMVKEVLKSKKDPATGKFFERKFIEPREFTKYINWQEAPELIKLALESDIINVK